MRRTPKLALIAAAALAMPLLSTPAVAITYGGGSDIDCVRASLEGQGESVLDRDNTGAGYEDFRVEIYDGNNIQIFSNSYTNALTSYPGGLGTFTYSTAPTANPIRVYTISEAGNGLAEETQKVASGTCDALRPPLTLDPSATTEVPTTEVPETTTTLDDGTTTVVPTPTTASPTPTVKPNTNVRPAKGAKPRAGTSRYTG